MPGKQRPTSQASEHETAVRRVLHNIVQSKTFRPVDRLQRFLTYIVEETLAGRGDMLKEYPVGVDVFGKESSFDPRMDPIVRVQARRLRMRLVTYYADEGQADPIVIEMPKGGYAPTFRNAEPSHTPQKAAAGTMVSRNSVAVLSFEDDSSDHNLGYFCNGLAQEIIQALGKMQGVVVMSARGGEARKAAMLVEGSVRRGRDVLRITVHITDTLRGSYLWSESFDRAPGDDLAVQEEISRRVVEVLREEVVNRTPSAAHSLGTNNLIARNFYVQGRYHLEQRTEIGLNKALEFFIRATEEDPKMAVAYAGLADAYNLRAHYGACAPAETWTKAASAAAQAVTLDDASSEAHASLAHLKATQDWEWTAAETEFQRAISLNPHNAVAHLWYGVSCLASLNRLDEALNEVKLAQAIDPVSSIVARNIALIHYYQRNLDLALEQSDLTIEQNPHFAAAYWTLGLVQEQRGELDEAVAALQRAIELSPPNPRVVGALGGVFAKHGRREEAQAILEQLKVLSETRYISPFEPALINFNLGRREEGFELLSQAFRDRCFELITIHIDPRFDSVRNDPRYKTLFKKLNLS